MTVNLVGTDAGDARLADAREYRKWNYRRTGRVGRVVSAGRDTLVDQS